MTENEAIELLNKVMFPPEFAITEQGSKMKVVWDMAIQALEEIQQYRAIGTVERFRFLQEVCDLNGDELENIANSMIELKNYRAIGTIDEFKALKEKSVEKKPHSISIANDIGNSMVECPICHARSDYDVKSIKRGYCWKCGQKLDWSE